MRVAWEFYDPNLDTTYILPVNPNADNGSNTISKNVKYAVAAGMHQNSAGDDVISSIVNSTGSNLRPFSYTGNLYTLEQLTAFKLWFAKRYPIEIQDDLGRRFLVLIETFEINRVKSNAHRLKHSYSFAGTILERII